MPEKKSKNFEIDSGKINQKILRLAHFDPTCKDEYGNQVIDYLVLDSLSYYGPIVSVTPPEITKLIKNNFLLDFEVPEIDASASRLKQKSMINYNKGEKGESGYEALRLQILPEVAEKIEDNRNKVQELTTKVLEDWKEELLVKYKDYPVVKDNINSIEKNLLLFASKMFIRHGVECVAILYPTDQKTKKWQTAIKRSILGDLPKIDDFVDFVAKIEVPNFFKNPNSERRAYITSLFNSSFMWHLIQVDEKCSKLLKEVTKGQKLCLDNNILYDLIGLHGANMLQSVDSMLKLAKKLGYELWVTSKTVDEFHASLKWQMKEFKKMPPLPTDLARIALKGLEKDSFLALYWSEFVKNGTSIEEFIAEKSHLEDILQGLKIIKINKYRKEIEDSKELSKEMNILWSIVTYDTSEHIIEHDAFHRTFINKMRGNPKYHFNEAVAWFLTDDNKLPVYDRLARKGKNYLPFCITSNQWVQINRPLLVRTADEKEYEESFQIIVTQPFLRTMMPTFSLDKAYNVVLGRLARYKNMSTQLAFNIVADKHFMATMALETEVDKKEEKIESKFVDITVQLQSDKEALEKNVKTKNEDIEELKGKLSNLEKEVKESINSYQIQTQELKRDLKDEKSKSKKAEDELNKSKKLSNWAIFLFILVLASLFLWLHQFWINWPWLETHKNSIILRLISQFLLIFSLLNIPLKKYWKRWLGISVAMIIAFFGTAKY